jgi:pimeloyl-ACP methyl ester carboxylesterase
MKSATSLGRRQFISGALAAALGTTSARAAVAIDESGYVRIGGIDQWIAIRGDDVRNPVIVYLHGGPAEAQSPFLAEFRPWEKHFTVVNWDQRGSGNTLLRNGTSTPGMTLRRMSLDAVEVANYARRRLHKRRIILVCQSFGCILGIDAVRIQPSAFSAYVGTGQPVNWKLSLAAREEFARAQMRAAHDTVALEALNAATSLPPTDFKRLRASNKWRWSPSDLHYLQLQRKLISDPRPSANVVAWMKGGDFTGSKLWPAITAFDARRMTDFHVPIYVIQGREDHIVSFGAAKAWVESLHAPAKAFVAIDGGHFACFTDPGAFIAALERLGGIL